MKVRRRLWWGRGIGIGEDHSRRVEEVTARDKSGMYVSSACLLFAQG